MSPFSRGGALVQKNIKQVYFTLLKQAQQGQGQTAAPAPQAGASLELGALSLEWNRK